MEANENLGAKRKENLRAMKKQRENKSGKW